MLIPQSSGNNCPALILEIKLNCLYESLDRSLGDLSIDPNPIDEILPFNDMFAKSAKFASKLAMADHPPLFLMLDILSSLNHTSPDNVLPIFSEGFFNPKRTVFTLPNDGFPLIENLYFFSPGNWLI